MDNLVAVLADFLADYDIDVYDDASLGGDKYRLDCVIVETHITSLKARLRVQKALNAFNTFPDSPKGVTVVQSGPITMNERSEDEYDFSVTVEFKKTDERKKREAAVVPDDERPFTEEKFDDSITVKEVKGVNKSEYWGHEVDEPYSEITDIEVRSDISGELMDDGFRLPDGRDVTREEAMDEYRKAYNQRAVKTENDEIMLTDDLTEKLGYKPYTELQFKKNFDDFAEDAEYIALDNEDTIMRLYEEDKR